MAPYIWLVTASSSGFGRAVIEAALARGDSVIATLRTPSDIDDIARSTPPSQLLVAICDVTKQQDIENAFKAGVAKFGRIDIVLNNAGYGVLAEIESTPEEAARRLFDVTFWGAAAVSREAVRVFRDVNPPGMGGRLLTMSSGGGLFGRPALGYYSSSRFALEGFTESLALEMDPDWNIKITLIDLGSFRTKAHTDNTPVFPAIPAYSNPNLPSQLMRHRYKDPFKFVRGDVRKGAAKILEFTLLKDAPPLRLALGKTVIAGVRAKMQGFERDLADFEHWSDDLNVPDDE